ncbi:hypothetical protein ACJX0J_018171, partial [Zea mays]
ASATCCTAIVCNCIARSLLSLGTSISSRSLAIFGFHGEAHCRPTWLPIGCIGRKPCSSCSGSVLEVCSSQHSHADLPLPTPRRRS